MSWIICPQVLPIKLRIVMATATDQETSGAGEHIISPPNHITAANNFVFAVFLGFI